MVVLSPVAYINYLSLQVEQTLHLYFSYLTPIMCSKVRVNFSKLTISEIFPLYLTLITLPGLYHFLRYVALDQLQYLANLHQLELPG